MSRSDAVMVLGCGTEDFRGYLLKGLAELCDVLLVDTELPTWQRPYIMDHHQIDRHGASFIGQAVEIARKSRTRTVLTWADEFLEEASQVADAAGIHGPSRHDVSICRDKTRQRQLLPFEFSATFAVVQGDEKNVTEVASRIGYPLIVKPAELSGGVGVSLVRDETELHAALHNAASANVPGFPATATIVLEQYLQGDEYSVDCYTLNGVTVPYLVCTKTVSEPPHFVDIGYAVETDRESATYEAIVRCVTDSITRLEIDTLLTHTEVIMTLEGPRVVEVNGRIGGDLVPYLGQLITGIPAAATLLAVTRGEPPPKGIENITRSAAIQFIYPPNSMVLTSMSVDPALARLPWVHEIRRCLPSGSRLGVGPRLPFSRAGFVIFEADDTQMAKNRQRYICRAVVLQGQPED